MTQGMCLYEVFYIIEQEDYRNRKSKDSFETFNTWSHVVQLSFYPRTFLENSRTDSLRCERRFFVLAPIISRPAAEKLFALSDLLLSGRVDRLCELSPSISLSSTPIFRSNS